MLPRDFGLPATPWIIGHRGAADSRPENTLASVAAAVEESADMIEVDVQMTADGELLLVHDWEIELAGRRHVVEESDAEVLRRAAADGGRTAETPLPTLAELLAALPPELPINLDLKRRRADPGRWRDTLLPLLGARSRVLLSSFDAALLRTLRAADPRLALAPIGAERPHELLRTAESIRAATVHCHRRLAFSDFIAAARTEGWPVLVYTVNVVGLARDLFARGVTGVFTDRPAELRRELAGA